MSRVELKQSKLSYATVKHLMREFNRLKSNDGYLQAVIVFTEDSFNEHYPLEARSYVISNSNKAFIDGMGGYSIFASSLDGADTCIRLDAYMAEERGGSGGWRVDYCYFV